MIIPSCSHEQIQIKQKYWDDSCTCFCVDRFSFRFWSWAIISLSLCSFSVRLPSLSNTWMLSFTLLSSFMLLFSSSPMSVLELSRRRTLSMDLRCSPRLDFVERWWWSWWGDSRSSSVSESESRLTLCRIRCFLLAGRLLDESESWFSLSDLVTMCRLVSVSLSLSTSLVLSFGSLVGVFFRFEDILL